MGESQRSDGHHGRASGPADRGRRLREPALVGRRAELAVVRAAVERGPGRGVCCLLFSGEPGGGQGPLARALLWLPQLIGLLARAYPWGSTTPFGMWAEAFEGYLRDLTRPEVVGLCGGFADDLDGLLRTVAAARGRAPGPDPPRARLLQGLAVLLGNL